MMKTIPQETEAQIKNDEGAKLGSQALRELLPQALSSDKPPLASVAKTFSSGSQINTSTKKIHDTISPNQDEKSPPVFTQGNYSNFLDRNMKE